MSLVIVDIGKKALLDKLTNVGGVNLVNALAHLYTNNHTPAHGDVLGSYTEASYGGYAAQTLSGWPASSLNGSNRAASTAGTVTFSNTSGSGQSVYGWFLTDSTGVTLIGAELFTGGPITLPSGFAFALQVTFTEQSEF